MAKRLGGVEQVAADRVHDAFGRPRGPRRRQDEERLSGLERLAGAGGVHAGRRHGFVPPHVAAADQPRVVFVVVAATGDHDDRLDRGVCLEGAIDLALEPGRRTAAPARLRSDHDAGAPGVDAGPQGLAREAREHDGVDGAQPGAGKHGDGQLGNHRQIQDDPVAGHHAATLEHVGETRRGREQVGVGELLDVAVGAHVDQRATLSEAGGHVAVDAVEGGVDPAAGKPARVGGARRPGGEVGREDLIPGGIPGQDRRRALGPERLGLVEGALVQLLVRDQTGGRPRRRRPRRRRRGPGSGRLPSAGGDDRLLVCGHARLSPTLVPQNRRYESAYSTRLCSMR